MSDTTRPNDPAYPTKELLGYSNDGFPSYNQLHGLTKREYFATMALGDLIKLGETDEVTADLAVSFADALINRLNQ